MKKKRYYPIIENFDDVKGIELEGPLGTIYSTSEKTKIRNVKVKKLVREEIQNKILEDETFNEDNLLLVIKNDGWKYGRDWCGNAYPSYGMYYFMECQIYRTKTSQLKS